MVTRRTCSAERQMEAQGVTGAGGPQLPLASSHFLRPVRPVLDHRKTASRLHRCRQLFVPEGWLAALPLSQPVVHSEGVSCSRQAALG